MARQAKVVITSENKSSAGVKSAISDILGLDDAAKKIGSTLKSAFSVLAIAAAAKEVVRFGVDSVKAFGDMERSMLQLRAALGNNETSFSKMSGLIDEMGKKTTASMDDIEHLVAELASLGKSDAEIEKITRASVALSNVTGGSLSESMTKLLAAQEGQTKGLKVLVPEIGNLTKEQLAAGGATSVLLEKLGAVSDAMAGGVAQDFSNLAKSADDLKEALGQNLAAAFSPMARAIQEIIDKWAGALTEYAAYRDAIKKDAAVRTAEENLTIAKHQKADLENAIDLKMRNAGYGPGSSTAQGSPYARERAMLPEQARLTELAAQILELEADLIAKQAAASAAPRIAAGALVPVIPPDERPAWAGGWNENLRAPSLYEPGDVYSDTRAEWGGGMSERNLAPGGYEDTLYRSSATSGAGLSSNSLNPLAPIMDGLSKLGGGFMSMIGSLSSVQSILDPLSTILGAAMEVLGPLIDEALAPLVGMLKIVGAALGEILTPIVKALGKVIEFVMQGILWVWNGIVKAINWALGWAGVNLKYATLASASAAGTAPSSSSSSSGGSGAAYTGAQSITFNFFNQGNVVGSGGLEELAALIDSIITRNARYA